MLSDRLGISVWYAVVGGSLGGMQALQWSVDYPDRLQNVSLLPVRQSFQHKILRLTKWHVSPSCPTQTSIMAVIWKMIAIEAWSNFGSYGWPYYLSF